MTKLKECPCCGGPAEIRAAEVADRYLVRCEDYENCYLGTGECDIPDQAVAVWNRRYQATVAVEASKINDMVERFAESLCNSSQPQIKGRGFWKTEARNHTKERWRQRVRDAFDYCGFTLKADIPTRDPVHKEEA